jgi:hypothetical protein
MTLGQSHENSEENDLQSRVLYSALSSTQMRITMTTVPIQQVIFPSRKLPSNDKIHQGTGKQGVQKIGAGEGKPWGDRHET